MAAMTATGVDGKRPAGYILKNAITHLRFLPTASKHSFKYSTLSFLVSVSALEKGDLDIARGWLFGYGGLWGRLTGLRSDPYLEKLPGNVSIRDKLENVVAKRFGESSRSLLRDAWMSTIPSILGFEGINPLTVYFCYKSDGTFWFCLFEIHNTFGESHIHHLEVGKSEDSQPASGYDHQWTVAREFHVSPFNDRTGFYRISLKLPSHLPFDDVPHSNNSKIHHPLPAVRVQVLTASPHSDEPCQLKLHVIWRATSAAPLTASSLLSGLAWAPLAMFLTFSRILYHAWILHYMKRLDVFIRPEPRPAIRNWPSNINGSSQQPAGGIKWQDEGYLERFARHRVVAYLHRRVDETGIIVTLVSSNPSSPPLNFCPKGVAVDAKDVPLLEIFYLAPRIFTTLFLAPSPAHARLLGCTTENIFNISSESLFDQIFTPSHTEKNSRRTLSQRLRVRNLPNTLASSDALPIPLIHPLDLGGSSALAATLVVGILLALERLEQWVFTAARARPVPGDEPWKQWDRAASMLKDGPVAEIRTSEIGSLRRDN